MNNLFVICQNYLEEEYGVDIASHFSNIFYDKQIEYTDNTHCACFLCKTNLF